MLDANFIGENRELVERGLKERGARDVDLDRICALNAERKKLEHEVGQLRHEKKELGPRIQDAKKRADPEAEKLLARSGEVKEREKAIDARQREVEGELRALLLLVPNLPHAAAPRGDAAANRVARTWGERRTFEFEPKDQMVLCERLGVVDLKDRGVKVAGSGFLMFRGLGAKLERALINWMLDLHVREHGYVEISPPFVVNDKTMTGTGQLPKFAEELYQIEKDGLWLIPTAEVPVTNIHADEVIPHGDLPIGYCAYTPCFRREAGAAGKMTKGLKRVHQFDKVELVRFCRPEAGDEEHEKLLRHCTRIVELLGLEHRVLELATGDTGFASARTFDIECYAPATKEWLEVSSVSTFTDFQARRASIRFKDETGKTRFVHTLNGSGVACPRIILCILETFQRRDGGVDVPAVLRPYVGADVIG